ncbi:FimD/PapC C-terminal domain-containing protein, partial [Serratia marcescens]|uniref:FimD/PapC C-terminal domain-containing protein n=1 Tax=Serratia marcescens TaxID=615 RepID=UPI0011E7C47C
LITANQNGKPLPFGAEVTDSRGQLVGYVGQGSQIYARVNYETDTLTIQWNDAGNQKCNIRYRLMPQAENVKKSVMQQFNSSCQL